jgi:putative ABC transport system permease protein
MSRRSRWIGIIGVGLRRAITRATRTNRRRVAVSVFGVVVAISLLVVVTGIAIGVGAGTTVYDDETDYWIVPESDTAESPLLSTDGPQFGSVHEATGRITSIEGVDAATPILSQIYRVEANDSGEYVLVFGIINEPELETVLGLDTASLTQGDPYHASGDPTDELVLSSSAAELLGVSEDDTVTIRNTDFTVTAVSERSGSTVGNVPAALVHLSELQAITGADTYDQADQFVVKTQSPGVKSELEGVYPESAVYSRSEMIVSQTLDSDLSLALSLTSFIVSIVIGTLFVVTTMGLEIVADSRDLMTLSAIGISTRSQLGIVGMQIFTTVGIGGLLGGGVGLGAVTLVNQVAIRTLTSEPIALFHPLLGVYGFAVSIVVACVSVGYLLFLTRRVTGSVPTR